MTPKILRDKNSRMFARRERDAQWALMERIAREDIVWICHWDKHGRHKNGDGVYVFGLIGAGELYQWLSDHKEWFKRGPWVANRCARSLRLTTAGLAALDNRAPYDMEPIHGGMVEPGYIVTPWPRKKTA